MVKPLSIGIRASIIRFGEIKPQAFWVLYVELFNEIQSALAQRLTDRVKVDKYQICQLSFNNNKRQNSSRRKLHTTFKNRSKLRSMYLAIGLLR